MIHRDIKPENILLQNGHALVADFGIARGDCSALGAVTYEMFTGEPPFTDSTVQTIVAKVLTERPTAISAVRDTVSPSTERAVLRALAKLPADRFASIKEFAHALTVVTQPTTSVTAEAPRSATQNGGARKRLPLTVVAAAMTRAAGVGIGVGVDRVTAPTQSSVDTGRSTKVTWDQGMQLMPTLSPDGKRIAYAETDGIRSRLYIGAVDGGRSAPLTDDFTAVEHLPRWSADGTRTLFISNGHAVSTPAGGGAIRQQVTKTPQQVIVLDWSPDGWVLMYGLMAGRGGLFFARRDPTGAWSTGARIDSGNSGTFSHDGWRILSGSDVGVAGWIMPTDSGAPR